MGQITVDSDIYLLKMEYSELCNKFTSPPLLFRFFHLCFVFMTSKKTKKKIVLMEAERESTTLAFVKINFSCLDFL